MPFFPHSGTNSGKKLPEKCAAIQPALQTAAAHTGTAIYKRTLGNPTQSNPSHTRCSHTQLLLPSCQMLQLQPGV